MYFIIIEFMIEVWNTYFLNKNPHTMGHRGFKSDPN